MAINRWVSNRDFRLKLFACSITLLLILSFAQLSFHHHKDSVNVSVYTALNSCHAEHSDSGDLEHTCQKNCEICILKHFLSHSQITHFAVSCIVVYLSSEFVDPAASEKGSYHEFIRKRGPPSYFTVV